MVCRLCSAPWHGCCCWELVLVGSVGCIRWCLHCLLGVRWSSSYIHAHSKLSSGASQLCHSTTTLCFCTEVASLAGLIVKTCARRHVDCARTACQHTRTGLFFYLIPILVPCVMGPHVLLGCCTCITSELSAAHCMCLVFSCTPSACACAQLVPQRRFVQMHDVHLSTPCCPVHHLQGVQRRRQLPECPQKNSCIDALRVVTILISVL
jgi:hypothetical protein